MAKGNGKGTVIGMVINTATKPCRDMMLGIMDCIRQQPNVRYRLFHGSAATQPQNLAAFAASGVDGLAFCGLHKDIVSRFLQMMPDHPPMVLSLYRVAERKGG